jgi:hydrogenase maturation protease
MDGGTQGLYLVDHVRKADVLVVLDAVDYGLEPGTIKLVEDGEVPKFLGAKKMSLHQTGFQEVLATADLFGDLPAHILLVGVQPVELEDYGGSLRDRVKACIPAANEAAIAYLARHGIAATPRSTALPDTITLSSPEMSMAAYETGRPSEATAYRHGDARVVFASPSDEVTG